MEEKVFHGLREMYDNLDVPFPRLNSEPMASRFKLNLCQYGVNTAFGEWAQAEGQSRGDSYNFVYLTEVDFYQNWDRFWGGLQHSIANEKRSVVLIESTACGRGALWDLYQKTKGPDSEYECVFVPWYVQEEYRKEVPEGTTFSAEDLAYKEKYNLSDEQLYWYICKRQDSVSGLGFKHEISASIEESFSVGSSYAFFDFNIIDAAMKNEFVEDGNQCELVVGIDPSRLRDKTALCLRRGRNVIKIETIVPEGDIMAITKKIELKLREWRPDSVYVDVGGLGCGVYDRLREIGFTSVYEVQFGSAAEDKLRYKLRRTELYARAKEWLSNQPVHIPNDREFDKQLRMIEFEPNAPVLTLVSKDKLQYSPDMVDAFVMTFSRWGSEKNQDFSGPMPVYRYI